MNSEVFSKIQECLNKVSILKHVGEDWGQLDNYGERPPVSFPCCLYDISKETYTDASGRMQQVVGEVMLRIAAIPPRNTSSRAPDNAMPLNVFSMLNDVYKAVQGVSGETFSPLTRTLMAREHRDDGVREYVMCFKYSSTDTSACKTTTKVTPKSIVS